ncbi:HAUS augmin-like complex subunit 4 [Taeniopygia guttata]|uniref:HAUS augmin-like complex subunit 4 n=1 Tax=Taeniopygia guttata TaxID=59729 RepID=UPI003BB86B5B
MALGGLRDLLLPPGEDPPNSAAPQELRDHPGLARLLRNLGGLLGGEGLSPPLRLQLRQAEASLSRARGLWLRLELLWRLLEELIRDPRELEPPVLRALEQELTVAQLRRGPPEIARLLPPEQVSPILPRLLPELQRRLREKREQIWDFLLGPPKNPPNPPKIPQIPPKNTQIPQNAPKNPENSTEIPQIFSKNPENSLKIPLQIPPELPQNPENLPQNPQNFPKISQNVPKNPENLPKNPENLPKIPQNFPKTPKIDPKNPKNFSQNFEIDPKNFPQIFPKNPENLPKNPQNPENLPQNFPKTPKIPENLPKNPQNFPKIPENLPKNPKIPQIHPENLPKKPENLPQNHPKNPEFCPKTDPKTPKNLPQTPENPQNPKFFPKTPQIRPNLGELLGAERLRQRRLRQRLESLGWEYPQALRRCLSLLSQLRLLGALQTHLDEGRGRYLLAKGGAVLLKSRLEELHILLDTYPAPTIEAHRRIRAGLCGARDAAQAEAAILGAELEALRGCGPEFRDLALEFGRIRRESEQKGWALRQLRPPTP